MKQRFFFYGTLTHEVESDLTNKLHEKLEFVGVGFVTGRLFVIPWGDIYYPALILDENGYCIYGNCYETKDDFSDNDLKMLDDYEEFYPDHEAGSEYVRQEMQVNVGSEKMTTNVYVYYKVVPNQAIEIISGDFVKFMKGI